MKAGRETRICVIGIGNTLVSDDGVGILSLQLFAKTVADDRLTLVESERGGMDLLDILEGFDAAVLIDAAQTGLRGPGEVDVFSLQAPFTPGACSSLHTINLRALLAFGEVAGMALPRGVTVVSVEAKDIETFHEGCTQEVARALPEVVERLGEELRRFLPDLRLVSPHGSHPGTRTSARSAGCGQRGESTCAGR
jgi:hydrogenase maturation protease